jgi:hypothetical protein
MNQSCLPDVGVLYTPQKAKEISEYLNSLREKGQMYAPLVIGKSDCAKVQIFDSNGYSIGYL